jgi:hypothetical protein
MSSSQNFEEENLPKTAALVHIHTPEPAVANSEGFWTWQVHLKMPEEANLTENQLFPLKVSKCACPSELMRHN